MGVLFTYELITSRPKTIGDTTFLLVGPFLGWGVACWLVTATIRKVRESQDSN
jgi:hypothetical protein